MNVKVGSANRGITSLQNTNIKFSDYWGHCGCCTLDTFFVLEKKKKVAKEVDCY